MENERRETRQRPPQNRQQRPPESQRRRPSTGSARRKGERNSRAAQIARQRREEREAAAAQEAQERRAEREAAAKQEAERRQRERKKRESRAAQEAQRRREERKERKRLDNVREKQKTQAKHRTRWRISPGAWKRLLIMGGVVVAVLLSMVIFFRVQNVEVSYGIESDSGSYYVQNVEVSNGIESASGSYYTKEEIIAAAGIAEGDNLLLVSRSEVAGNIMAKLPYVKSVRVTRSLPDTLVLTVTEFEATYAVQDTVGDYYLITAGGKATERVEERDAKSHILIQDMVIETPTIGEPVKAAQGQLNALTKLLQEIELSGLEREIASVSVPSSTNMTLWYGTRFLVRLGDSSELDYKLEFLKRVISEQEVFASGTIDLSLSNGREAHVTLDE